MRAGTFAADTLDARAGPRHGDERLFPDDLGIVAGRNLVDRREVACLVWGIEALCLQAWYDGASLPSSGTAPPTSHLGGDVPRGVRNPGVGWRRIGPLRRVPTCGEEVRQLGGSYGSAQQPAYAVIDCVLGVPARPVLITDAVELGCLVRPMSRLRLDEERFDHIDLVRFHRVLRARGCRPVSVTA